MGRKPYGTKVYKVTDIVKEHPGISPSMLMYRLGYKKKSGVDSLLANCEQRGMLLYEDDNEGLYHFSIEVSEEGDRNG
jgi:hypothetical protein